MVYTWMGFKQHLIIEKDLDFILLTYFKIGFKSQLDTNFILNFKCETYWFYNDIFFFMSVLKFLIHLMKACTFDVRFLISCSYIE